MRKSRRKKRRNALRSLLRIKKRISAQLLRSSMPMCSYRETGQG